MKVVYNACYGGFGLSHAAVMRYAEIKGIKLYPFVCGPAHDFYNATDMIPKPDTYTDEWKIHYCTVPKYSEKKYFSPRDIERDDPALVQAVEELGKKASGSCAQLAIEDVPSGTAYRIEEYAGFESVMTQDSYDWKIAR